MAPPAVTPTIEPIADAHSPSTWRSANARCCGLNSQPAPQALERALGGGVDLIVLDLGLPELDGLEVARRLRADPTGDAIPVGVDDIVAQQVKEWEPVFRCENRRIGLSGVRGLTAVVSPGGLSQIVTTLLDNSLVHGDGQVTIHTKETATSIVVEVGDEGSGVPPDLERRVFDRNGSGRQDTGLGLYLARSLATADGGLLELVRSRPATFAIFLRKREEALLAKERVVSGPA